MSRAVTPPASVRRLLSALSLAAALALAGCARPGTAPPSDDRRPDNLQGTLTVFAAASLTDVFEQLAHQFEADHAGLDVAMNYGGSSALAQQLLQGAPADVFAAASESAMQLVTDAGLAADPVVFATNTIELAVSPGNPARVHDLSDLARPELAVALCAPEVPCGEASHRLLDHAGVTASVDTLEQDVRAVLTKVELGEVDAGLVYRTDVLSAGSRVDGIAIPDAPQFQTRYPIAATGTANGTAAAAFVQWVLSPAGKELLRVAGFGTP